MVNQGVTCFSIREPGGELPEGSIIHPPLHGIRKRLAP